MFGILLILQSLTPFQNAVPVTVPTQYSQAQVPVTGAGSNTVVLLQPPPSTANSSSTSPNTTGTGRLNQLNLK